MKIDRSKLKKSSSEVPADCKGLIDRLTSTTTKAEFLAELQRIETWTYGKCELLHWIDVLDLCDEVLEAAANRPENKWALAVDGGDDKLKELVLWTLHFTTLLIEHSFSRHLYSSMEHLTTLLASSDLDVVLAVLNLLYMFSKRSNFIARLAQEKRSGLLSRLTHLAAGWGGKDNGFGLSKCCSDDPINSFPDSATTLHFEFYAENSASKNNAVMITVIHLPHVDQLGQSPAELMEKLLSTYSVPEEKQMQLFTYLRLASSFSHYSKRLKCVQARLQALSVLIYSNTLTENVQSLLYSGLLEELVEVLEMDGEHLMEIKASALKALTSIIHLDSRNPNYPKLNTIIDVTGASSYHGFLPVMVRNCIASLTRTSGNSSVSVGTFPQPLATALFSFLYHLASFEAGGDALVSCGMMESLLKVIQWPSTELDHITFVTRAVRVIDLITNLDMQSFQTHQGLNSFIKRLELEVDHCRQQQPFQIQVGPVRRDSLADAMEQQQAEEEALAAADAPMASPSPASSAQENEQNESNEEKPLPDYSAAKTGLTCLPQRAALLKSMLNFLKKAIQDQALSDSIRHVMDGSLPGSLKHIISNAEYYGPSLFLLATDVVTNYVFQEPSLLSSLQDNGLTDVVLHALLVKDVPATREVLGSLPNVFSALCLNNRGLNAFVECRPFERLFKVLLSPDYLPAMRRRRSSDPLGDTASNLGNAMDELMRHQPSLKTAATGAIIKLLEEVCTMGKDPKYICWKTSQSNNKVEVNGASNVNPTENNAPGGNEAGGSSDEEDDDEEETGGNNEEASPSAEAAEVANEAANAAKDSEKEAVPLVDYIHNVMKFVDAILSNNATDDHCREFVVQKGLLPLMGILGLPNLPIDFPTHAACQAVSAVSKSILNLAHEPQVLTEGLTCLHQVLKNLEPLHKPIDPPGGSVLLRELVTATATLSGEQATNNPQATPLLHHMAAAHAYIQMFVTVNRTGQNEIRNILVNNWGSELGLNVLRGLSKLYTSLVWESNILLALCSEDALPAGCEFGKADMDKLLPTASAAAPNQPNATGANADEQQTFSPSSGSSGDSSSSVTVAMENLTTDPESNTMMDVDSENKENKDNKATNTALHHQIKQIKPLLSVSSRLGRALVELFALLVKLCVGSPLRQRRGQQMPATPAPPSPPARAVASALTKLLASGLSWEPPQTSPIPKFRLTFFICSLGFTSPMLFDEKKMPYHLMLQKFILSGGQNAFFDAFYWALSVGYSIPPEDGLDADLPEFTGEFLDSWLVLLEKMVNPKAVLESPHTLPKTASKTTGGNYKPFDPLKYLTRTHRLAFQAVMKIWGKKPLKTYGARMSESVLTILCHILKGEKIISEQKEKTETERNGLNSLVSMSSSSGNPIPVLSSASFSARASAYMAEVAAASIPEPAPEPNQADVATLMDMGFPRERCIEALTAHSSLDAATDYLLNNPVPPPSARPPVILGSGISASSSNSAQPSTESGGPSTSSTRTGEQEEMMRAIALSLGGATTSETNTETITNAESSETTPVVKTFVQLQQEILKEQKEKEPEEDLPDEEYEPLTTEVIDEFAVNALTGCLSLLDSLPDTVYRVCDLLLAVFNRNGTDFKESILRSLIGEVHEAVKRLSEAVSNEEAFVTGDLSSKASVRIHLFTLLFEECKVLAAKIVDESNIISAMIDLLSSAPNVLQPKEKQVTPKWMTPLLLFIDLYEKVILGMNRRAALEPICTHSWKYFDGSKGEWRAYSAEENKKIDDAFWAGDSSVRIQMQRQGRRTKYTIQFGTMMQSNEETGNRRPLMISLLEPNKSNEDQDMKEENSGESAKKSLPSLKKLTDEECSTLLTSCVSLMGLNVDADALNAILRLLLRLTQDFEQAVVFAQLGGVKMLLDLTQASTFSGFSSLATLLIRHVMEDPNTLKNTMEKVMRSQTAVNASTNTNYKELHYMLHRMLAPAACRRPALFQEVAKELLRVDFNLLKKTGDIDEDKRLLLKSLPGKQVQNTVQLHEVSKGVICDLLNFLIRAPPPESEKSEKKSENLPNDVSHGAKGANRTQQVIVRNSSSIELQVSVPEGAVPPESNVKNTSEKPSSNDSNDNEESNKKRPLMSKASVCRLLAELVKSYGSSASLITEHVYEAGMSDLVKEDTTALAFLLDELLVSKNSDKECSNLIKILVAALASVNHYPEAQATLVIEVKGALNRALSLQESNDKHTKIQALASLIETMIQACPSTQSQHLAMSLYRPLQYNMNNMVKVMLKKGIVTDLARVTHSLDLSSPNVAATINAVLKPLETLSKNLNQPTGIQSQRGNKNGKNSNSTNTNDNNETANNTDEAQAGNQNGTNTTNSEATRAQGDETVEPDAEATEHDISTANESMDPNSESQLHTVEEGNDEEFEDMMDQLLERDAAAPEIIAEAIDHHMGSALDSTLDDTHHDSQMITQDESQIEAQQMSQDEDEDDEDEDEDDHESESSRDSNFDGANEENDDGIEVEGEEEEEEDEDDDDDEGDDDDDEDQFQELDEAFRFPLGDNGDDDLDLMIQYPDEGGLAHNHIEQRMRGIHLPLWSEMMHQGMGGNDHANVGGVSVGANSHVSPNHPLLMGRQGTTATLDPNSARNPNRGLARQLQRGFRGYFHLGSRTQNATAPTTILQNFLGSNGPHAQELFSSSLRRGTPLLVDFGYAILDSLENEVSDIDNSVLGNGGRDALSTIPSALIRWNEESRVIDGDSMHDCVTSLKPPIVEIVEKEREVEVAQRKAKKKKELEEEEMKRKASEEAAAKNETNNEETSEENVIASSTPNDTLSGEDRMAQDLAAAISSRLNNQEEILISNQELPPPPPPPFPNQFEDQSLPAVLAPLSPSPEQSTANNTDVVMRSENASPQMTSSERSQSEAEKTEVASEENTTAAPQEEQTEQPASETANTVDGAASALAELNEPGAGPSGTSSGVDYSSILGMDVRELPDGVDPSFLAALPEDMRQEVIEEQRRLQSIRQRAAQNVEAGVTEVNPEFLAALPPSIQEEILNQQRIEQQRQAAQANPEAPVDAGELFQSLSEPLRQQILADMDESQIPGLPEDLAAEAQLRRRELQQQQTRAHHHMHEHARFFGQGNYALSSILRNTVNRIGNSYIVQGSGGRMSDAWRHSFGGRGGSSGLGGHHSVSSLLAPSSAIKVKGRQLLDQEGLSCLLIVLFIDDPKINSARLHRILRNLCYHSGTREWVIKSLLSILEKSNEHKSSPETGEILQPSAAKIRKSNNGGGSEKTSSGPSWLTISMDAALGFRANVFQVARLPSSGGKKTCSTSANSVISIHPGASAVVCRHTLEVLIYLAKPFSEHFLPIKTQDNNSSDSQTSSSGSSKKSNNDLWETLLKLDQNSSKKGKSVARSHSNVGNLKEENVENIETNFELTPFGQLLAMLSSPVIRRNSVLTDKLLRLLSLISIVQQQPNEKKSSCVIKAAHLKLAVEVLTSKTCSEEGLEDVTALLLNLSGHETNRDSILALLLQGAQELGNVVRQNIIDLQSELQGLKSDSDEETPGGSGGQNVEKGAVIDRFTKEAVVISAPSKVKGSGPELQLPSMNALTNKTSSQAFFLRVLKVIIQLRDAALHAIKKATKKSPTTEEKDMETEPEIQKLPSLSDQLSLEILWDTLSSCLKDLADTPDHHAVLVLQATVEAFFLVHAAPTQPEDKKKVQQKETRQEQLAHIQEQNISENVENSSTDGAKKSETKEKTSSPEDLPEETQKFLAFAETHRTVLNQILRQSTVHLADGPFSVLVDHTRVLDFDIKRRYFRTELERMDENLRREDLAVHVRRENVFEDSFRELHRRTPEEWKNRFYIVFEGEEGQDAGGLLREWYVIISKEIFNPMYALFKTSPGDKVTYMIYEQSQTNPNHLDYFKFVGRVIAKAIYDNKHLECYFTRSFYKHILAKYVKYTDMESEDYSFYKGLEFLMHNKVEDLGYDLTFSTEIREFGVLEVRDLIPNGRNVPVTEDNKMDYVRLVCQMKMTGAIRKQLSAFLEGFYNIIPRRLISIFNEQELELLVSGLPVIDIDDLKANTEYHKYQANSLQIIWFWRALRSFDQTDKAKFLQFVTGSSKVPLQGFQALEGMNGAQKFQIHRDDRSTDRLPSAHTCFNQLDLPAYETYDKLKTYLMKAIQECSEGFGFA